MRNLIKGVIGGAADQLQVWGDSMASPAAYTDDELVDRYVRFHQGRPSALLDFAGRDAPRGTDVLSEAARYETRMETLLARRQ